MSLDTGPKIVRPSRLRSLLRPAWRAVFKKYNDRNRLRQIRAEFWTNTREDQAYLAFFREFIKPGDLVFDIGANLGRRAKVFLQLGARVVAVEPQSSCASEIRTVLGHKRRLEILQIALSNSEGTAEMMISNASYVSSLSTEHVEMMKKRFANNPKWSEQGAVEWSGRETIQTRTLDSLIAQYGVPDFVKIDVEGFEYEVVQGLTRPIKRMSLEFTAERIEKTYQSLDRLNSLRPLEGQVLFDDSMEWKLDGWQRCDALKQSLARLTNVHRTCIGDIYLRTM